jgi:protein-disulfide isomerase
MTQDTPGPGPEELGPRPQGPGPSAELSTPPAPGPGALGPGPDKRTAGPWLVGIALLCLGASAAMWVQTRADVAALRTSVRSLNADVAALRRDPIIDVSGAPALGREDQVVTLIEFSDYECPFCIRHFTQTTPLIQKQFIDTGRIRYVFRDFPIDELHPAAIRAHAAARCAGEQGRFWEMHNRLFSAAGSHGDEALKARAAEAGLTAGDFASCLASDRTLEDIRKTGAIATAFGATGTPSFFIGLRDLTTNQVKIYQAITGAQPIEVFDKAIKAVEAKR